jgi:hypothetical protein
MWRRNSRSSWPWALALCCLLGLAGAAGLSAGTPTPSSSPAPTASAIPSSSPSPSAMPTSPQPVPASPPNGASTTALWDWLDQASLELSTEAQSSVTQSDELLSLLKECVKLLLSSDSQRSSERDKADKAIAAAEADRDKAKAEAEAIKAELQRWQIAAWSAGAFALAELIGLVLAIIF